MTARPMDRSTSLSGGVGRAAITFMAAAIYLFLYFPLAVLVLFSFQESSVLAFPIENWSLRWYQELARDRELLQSVRNSLRVAVSCVAVTVLVGVPIALALRSSDFPGKYLLQRVLLLPLLVPQLITGLAILIILNQFDYRLSLNTVILGQSIAWMPIVISQVYARLVRMGDSLADASMDLGANRWQTLWSVIMPNLITPIIGSGLLVFALAFDELPITFFLTGSENTLPMHIWSMLRTGITPEINAVGAITITLSIVLVLVAVRLLDRRKGDEE